MDIRVQGYESQVKLFLVLLVLFLVATGAVGLNVLYRSQSLLMGEAEGRITSSSRAVQREMAAGGEAPLEGPAASGRLQDLARAWSLSSLEVVDAAGRVVASTQPWRIGVIDPVAADVSRSDSGALASGGTVVRETPPAGDDPEYGPDRGEVVVFLPLRPGDGRILKTGHEVIGVRTVSRQIRLLAWTQAITGLVVLGLVFLFVRWVLRPYRALQATAAQIGRRDPPGVIDDPEDLIASFRGVIEKLGEQERELERMRAAAPRGAASAFSQETLDGLTSGVLILGADGAVTALNPAGEAILGAARDRIVGKDYRDVFAGSPELLAVLEDGVVAGRATSREVVSYRPAAAPDRTAHLGVTVSSLPGPGGGPHRAFCLFSDLTEIRGLQEKVRLKENLAGLGEMSAGIAHEFRNSLATILGYARLIDREGAGADHAGAIAREVQSIGRVVDEFLRFARPASIQPTAWDPRQVLTQVAVETARDHGRPGIRVAVTGEWPVSLRADEALLRQAFQNLLRNAFEAIPGPEGVVTVRGAMEDGGETLRIEVEDSGGGIPQEVLTRLFTPFVTTKDRGTGLGLALAQKAIVCHDGSISARNTRHGGACFVITLPTG